MNIQATCACGAAYQLKDEYAGRLVVCPRCGQNCRAGFPPGIPVGATGGDPVFARDQFLLRQKHLSVSEKYYVGDEQGRSILFVERPAHLLRNLAAAVVAFHYRNQNRFYVRDKRIGLVLAIWAGYQIVTGFASPMVDNFAHLGGLLGGVVLTWGAKPFRQGSLA
jgi:hypothetical protein